MDEDSAELVRDRLTISEVVEVLRDPAQYSVITQPPQRPKAGHVCFLGKIIHHKKVTALACMHTYLLEKYTILKNFLNFAFFPISAVEPRGRKVIRWDPAGMSR